MAGPLPTGDGATLNTFNAQLRANEEYRAFLRSIGVNPDGPVRLSDAQRSAAERWIRQRFPQLGNKLQVDPAGNLNTDHGLSTAWSNPYFRYPLIAGGALATAGALGAFGGAAGGSSAASGAAGGVLPSSQLAMSPLYTGPIVGGSQGASAAAAAAAAAAARGGGSVIEQLGPEAVSRSIGDRLQDGLTNPRNIAGLAALIPLLTQAFTGGGSESPYGTPAVNDEITKSLALQRGRVEQTQPIFDTLVNMSYGTTPTRYRGAPPANYPAKAQEAPAGPYDYSGPRFG